MKNASIYYLLKKFLCKKLKAAKSLNKNKKLWFNIDNNKKI